MQRHIARMTMSRRLILPTACAGLLLARLAQAEGPTGQRWRIAMIGDTPVAEAHPADITFSAEQRAYGSTGCNRFTGGYTLNGTTLRFSAMAGTRMACAPPAMAQEQRLHRAFDTVRGWRMDGPALLLTDEGGATLLRLEPHS